MRGNSWTEKDPALYCRIGIPRSWNNGNSSSFAANNTLFVVGGILLFEEL